MYRTIILLLLLVSGWANALTLSPMVVDKLIYTNHHIERFNLVNHSKRFMTYDVWVSKDKIKEPIGARIEVVGANDYRIISVPIGIIEPDTLEVYYICVQERPSGEELAVLVRICAKLRLYYPLATLHELQ